MAEAAKADKPLSADSQNIQNKPTNSDLEILKPHHRGDKLVNVTFRTERKGVWHKAIKSFYQEEHHLEERQIQHATQVNIFRRSKQGTTKENTKIINVNMYTSGIIMFQGKEVNSVLNCFEAIKKTADEVQKEDLGTSLGNANQKRHEGHK